MNPVPWSIQNTQIYRNGKISVCQGLGERGGLTANGCEICFKIIKMFDIGDICLALEYTKIYWILYFKGVHFMLCWLYIHEKNKLKNQAWERSSCYTNKCQSKNIINSKRKQQNLGNQCILWQ